MKESHLHFVEVDKFSEGSIGYISNMVVFKKPVVNENEKESKKKTIDGNNKK